MSIQNPYPLWSTRKSLGVMRAVKRERGFYLGYFPNTVLSDDEYIDFEKLPVEERRLAAFAMPLGRGYAVYDDSARAYRVKPAYVILDDQIDPLKPLSFAPGVDESIFDTEMDPMRRKELLRAAITGAHLRAYDRTLEYMASKAIIDGKITLKGPDYPTTLVDFGRNANHTIVLGNGQQFGDANVSVLDFVEATVDMVVGAEFGGMTTDIVMGNLVVPHFTRNEEILDHMDINTNGGRHKVERGLLAGSEDEDDFYKIGELFVGGNSGHVINLWVDNRTYIDPVTKTQTRFTGSKQMVFLSSPKRVNGFQCFGRIIDEDAKYKPMRLFPKNYRAPIAGGRLTIEHISHTGAPLPLPVNPNATASATVLA